MFSTSGAAPVMRVAVARLRAAPSTVAGVRGGAARWPISMPPARTKAKCSDQASGAMASMARAIASARAPSIGLVDAAPSPTPWSRIGR